MIEVMKIHQINCKVESIESNQLFNSLGKTLPEWLEENAKELGKDVKLLAFADDGVIWGIIDNFGKLITSGMAFPEHMVQLDPMSLQSLHLFGERGELRIWRGESFEYKACLLFDDPDGISEAFDKGYILWGTQVEETSGEFSLVSDGRQGLRHAIPLSLSKTTKLSNHPLRLFVRNYLSEDPDGQVYIAFSRLLAAEIIKEVKNEQA